MCVVMVDLSAFSVFADEHGDRSAADLASSFYVRAMQAGRRRGARPIKTVGDAVLFTAPDAITASRAAVALVREFEPGSFPLRVHAGVAGGSVMERDGDVFGSAVNLAAHLCSESSAGEILTTREVAEAARTEGISVSYLGRHALGLLHPVDVFRISSGSDLREAAS